MKPKSFFFKMKLKTGVVAITYERVKEDSIHHILKKEKGRGGGGGGTAWFWKSQMRKCNQFTPPYG